MSTRFGGQVAIVTGGASGIGLAVARGLAREGALVAVNDLEASKADQVASEVGGMAIPGDASLHEVAQARTAEVVERFGQVDILVTSAGIFYHGAAETITPDAWRNVMAVDLDGPFFWAQAAAPSMIARGAGAIVNIASASGLVAGPGSAPYTAAKHGVVGLTKALAVEWGPLGIRVNALCPGLTETEMVAAAWRGREQAYAERLARIPMGLAATPEEQAEAVLFLAARSSRSVNGLIMNVDGGTVALSSGYSVQHPAKS
jgi:NAD(P)-dependent dehydrogenase (short-subunit alcohol dehydrogenase family)